MSKFIYKKLLKDQFERFKKHPILSLFPIAISAIVLILLIVWLMTISSIPEKQIFFHETFDEEPSRWETLGSQLLLENKDKDHAKTIKLSSADYLAPHLKHIFTTEETPPDDFIVHLQVNISSFTSDVLTLCSLHFSTQPIVLVTNQDGRIGVSHQFSASPTYSNVLGGKLRKNHWEDIYIHVDGKSQQLAIYINNNKILTTGYKDLTYPLQELWLGTLWVKGSVNYGVPIDIKYDNITVGNEGILPKTNFIQHYLNLIRSLENKKEF